MSAICLVIALLWGGLALVAFTRGILAWCGVGCACAAGLLFVGLR